MAIQKNGPALICFLSSSSLFYRIGKDIKLFQGFSKAEEHHFRKFLSIIKRNTYYVVTDTFRELVKKLDSGEKEFAIGGPEGVGKSMALAAIASLYHEKRQCFLWSPLIRNDDVFKSYVEAIFGKFQFIR